jgi:hypothetical protein
MLKPQSIRKGVKITLNGKVVEKSEIIELSTHWSESQINFFKKMLQQGGELRINGMFMKITVQDKIVDSTGNKDQGIIVAPGLDQRF